MSNDELVKCEHCNAMLNPKNVSKHLRKVHRIGDDGQRLPAARKKRRLSSPKIGPYKSEPKEVICPVCGGGGGVRGGCYKCDGSGWVSSATRAAYHGNAILLGNQDNTRISNAGDKWGHIPIT